MVGKNVEKLSTFIGISEVQREGRYAGSSADTGWPRLGWYGYVTYSIGNGHANFLDILL